MAWYECLYGGGGGGDTTVHPVLIGQFTSSSASAVTRTLTDSIANYKYLWFSMSPITSDSVWLQNTLAYSGYSFVDIDYFRNNALTLRYTTSPSGTLTARTMTLTYVSDTTFTSQASTSDSRNLYVYGIKDMPGREGNGLDIANGSWIASDGTRGTFPVSITGSWCGFLANTEGYTTLTINNLHWVGVVGIKSDGTMESIILPSSTKYSTANITGYEYIWITHGLTSSHSMQFDIS